MVMFFINAEIISWYLFYCAELLSTCTQFSDDGLFNSTFDLFLAIVRCEKALTTQTYQGTGVSIMCYCIVLMRT